MDAERTSPAAYRFDRFTLDLARGALLADGGEELALRPKSFSMLRLFVENAGHLLDRDAIMAAVWPDLFVTDESIAQCVRDIRKALGDGAQRVLRTVPKRGFLLAAEATPVDPVAAGPSADLTQLAVAGATNGFAAKVPLRLVHSIQPGLEPQESTAVGADWRRQRPQSGTDGPPTIAVLPFQTLAAEERWNRLTDGLAYGIISDLARCRDVRVISRTSSFAYRGRDIDARRIGWDLGARYLLEGSLQVAEGRIRVTAQLVEVGDGTHLWSKHWDRPEGGLFEVQDAIVEEIVGRLMGWHGEIARADIRRMHRKPPSSLQAYELYLLGYEHEEKITAEDTRLAIRHLEQSLSLDPTITRAWTVLAWAYGFAATYGWYGEPLDMKARQTAAVEMAARLDPEDPIALEELGAVRCGQGDVAEGRRLFEQALAFAEGNADAMALLAKFVAGVFGRPTEGMAMMQRAMTLNPHAPAWYWWQHLPACYFSRAYEDCLSAVVRAPNVVQVRMFEVLSLAQLARTAELPAAIRRMRECNPDFDPNSYKLRLPVVDPAALGLLEEGIGKAGLV